MKKLKYVVVTPRLNSGGAIVLNNLYKNLIANGENAKIMYLHSLTYTDNNKFEFWKKWLFLEYKDNYSLKVILKKYLFDKISHKNIQNKTSNTKKTPFVGKNTVVVYPEITFGNPLRAKKVVRWLLYYNKLYSKDDCGNTVGYDKDDLFFAFRKVFNDKELNPNCRLLSTSYYDLELYKRTNYGERTGKCYIIRKGAARSDLPKEFDGIVIDDLPEKEKVEVFNKCEYCISYDTQTTYSSIAAMCGCISVVVPEGEKCRADYLSKGEKGYGVAYGFSNEEIRFAIDTNNRVLERCKIINTLAFNNVQEFVLECENYFNNVPIDGHIK